MKICTHTHLISFDFFPLSATNSTLSIFAGGPELIQHKTGKLLVKAQVTGNLFFNFILKYTSTQTGASAGSSVSTGFWLTEETFDLTLDVNSVWLLQLARTLITCFHWLFHLSSVPSQRTAQNLWPYWTSLLFKLAIFLLITVTPLQHRAKALRHSLSNIVCIHIDSQLMEWSQMSPLNEHYCVCIYAQTVAL